MNNLAPVLLFCYKRLDTLRQTVDALKGNYLATQTDLYVFSDAAKSETDAPIVDSIREYIDSIVGFKSVTVFCSPKNQGLANSIIGGVTNIIVKYGKVIVLEDDLISTPNFLNYMNAALERYAQSKSVFSVSGYSFNLNDGEETTDAYFLNRGWSWGWATWSDRWAEVDWDVNDYATFVNNRKKRQEFALGGSDLNAMLDKQMTGKLDSWAIRWFYHQFKIGGLTLYPVHSKILNNGFDADATHTTGSSDRYLPSLDVRHETDFKFPPNAELSQVYQQRFQRKMGILARALSKFQTLKIKLVRTLKLGATR